MSFIPTLELLAKVKTRLAALNSAPATLLFEKVEFYAHSDLVAALEDLRIFKQRVCLIVPSADSYESQNSGTEIQTEADREFVLLFADRDYGRRQDASSGDAQRVGVIGMKDIIEGDLLGANLDYNPRLLRLRPVAGEPVLLTSAEKDRVSGREAWAQTWRYCAGRETRREK